MVYILTKGINGNLCKLIIYDLNFMRNLKKKKFENIFCNILTFSKAFDSIPDFSNLGYQVKIVNLFKKFQRLHKPTTNKSIPT